VNNLFVVYIGELIDRQKALLALKAKWRALLFAK